MKACAGILVLLFYTFVRCKGYNIRSCGSNKKQDVQENQTTVFHCTGIVHAYSEWQIEYPDGTGQLIAACSWDIPGFTGTCTEAVDDTDILVDDDYKVNRNVRDKSELYLKGNDRTRKFASVRCAGGTTSAILANSSCGIRFVYPVESVTACNVSQNTIQRSASGSCEFNKVYASDGHYSCGWIQTSPLGGKTEIAGCIRLTSFTVNNPQYQRGFCTFTNHSLPRVRGNYNYSVWIDPNKHTIFYTGYLVVESPQSTTNNDNQQTGSRSFCASNADFESSPQPQGTTTSSTETSSTSTNGGTKGVDSGGEEDGLPLAAIAGGATGGLLFVIVIVVIIVCVVRRRDKKNKTPKTPGGKSDDQYHDTMHINTAYESSSDVIPSTGPQRNLPNYNGRHQSRDLDPHNTINEDDTDLGYTAVTLAEPDNNNTNKVSSNTVYEVDPYSAIDGEDDGNSNQRSAPHDNASYEYAVVNKIKKKKGAHEEPPKDVYAKVNKPKKSSGYSKPEPPQDGAVYAQVNKPRANVKPAPASKPKPATKPVMPVKPEVRTQGQEQGRSPVSPGYENVEETRNEVTQATETDDAYNHLSLSRPAASQKQETPEHDHDEYSHIRQ